MESLADKQSSGCWHWPGLLQNRGYGIVGRNPVKLAHRVMWEFYNGPIPKGMHICHGCDNPRCFNPEHIWAGTAKDNSRDFFAKGYRKKNMILDTPTVCEIRYQHSNGASIGDLCLQFQLEESYLSQILKRQIWKNA